MAAVFAEKPGMGESGATGYGANHSTGSGLGLFYSDKRLPAPSAGAVYSHNRIMMRSFVGQDSPDLPRTKY